MNEKGSKQTDEFEALVSRRGVIMAGRIGSDGRVAEHKSEGLFIEDPVALELAHWFVSAATMMFTSMAATLDQRSHTGAFDTTSWLPMTSWMYRGGDYALVVRGTVFVFVEAAKVKSLDELAGLLRQFDS